MSSIAHQRKFDLIIKDKSHSFKLIKIVISALWANIQTSRDYIDRLIDDGLRNKIDIVKQIMQ